MRWITLLLPLSLVACDVDGTSPRADRQPPASEAPRAGATDPPWEEVDTADAGAGAPGGAEGRPSDARVSDAGQVVGRAGAVEGDADSVNDRSSAREEPSSDQARLPVGGLVKIPETKPRDADEQIPADEKGEVRLPVGGLVKVPGGEKHEAPAAAGHDDRGNASEQQAEARGGEASPLSLEGPVKQGGLVRVQAPAGTKRVAFGGQRVVVAPDGRFLLGFAHDAKKEQKLVVTLPDGSSLEHLFEVEQRTYPDEAIDGLAEEEIRPKDPETRKRLAAEQRRIAKARSIFSDTPHYLEGFTWPARGPISSTYGRKRFFDGVEGGRHWGVDIAVPVGTPVKAPAGGTITYTGRDVPLSGSLVLIDHGHGLSSALLHLSEIAVKEGDAVKKGQIIGRSGATGRTTGAHLDWRMNLFQLPIDPQLVIAP
jgi:murein DD-endopeptidase MepM/ murein hydrolase activator NlpD